MHKDFRATDTRATETSSEPGDSDIAWKNSADREKKLETTRDKHFGSVRGWGGVIRRGSRQSCDSIMRLAAGFSDNRSSRSASPMPSMPSSPAEEPRPLFPPTPNRRSPFSPVSDTDDSSKPSRNVSPISSKAAEEAPGEPALGSCPPSPDDLSYQAVLANHSSRDGVFSGDDSSISNTTAKVTATQGSLRWDTSYSPRARTGELDRDISPGTSVKSMSMPPGTRSPRPRHQHTRSFHFPTSSTAGPDRSGLTSSSSEEHFGTSSLSNSTSFPSVLSASSSLSTDDHWSYNSLSPKPRLNSADQLNTLPTCMPVAPPYQDPYKPKSRGSERATTIKAPLEFLNTVESVAEPDSVTDGAVADIEDADDGEDDDEDEGFFIDFRKKEVRSNSLAAATRPQVTREQLVGRRKSSFVP